MNTNETRIKSNNECAFLLSFGIQFFLSNRNVCFVKRFFWYAHDEQSLSRLFLLLNCTSSFFGRFDEQKKQSGSSASQSRVVRVCVSTRSLFSLSLFSSSFVLTHFLGSQKSRHFLGFPSLSFRGHSVETFAFPFLIVSEESRLINKTLFSRYPKLFKKRDIGSN